MTPKMTKLKKWYHECCVFFHFFVMLSILFSRHLYPTRFPDCESDVRWLRQQGMETKTSGNCKQACKTEKEKLVFCWQSRQGNILPCLQHPIRYRKRIGESYSEQAAY